jgi:hypothetical protein
MKRVICKNDAIFISKISQGSVPLSCVHAKKLENRKKILPSNGADSPSVTLKIHLHSSCSSPLFEGVYTGETHYANIRDGGKTVHVLTGNALN